MSWEIEGDPQSVAPYAEHSRYRYMLRRGDEHREVFVEVSNTACGTDPATLPSPLDEVVRTSGRSVIEANLHRLDPPARVVVNSRDWYVVPREGVYDYRDRVYVREGEDWFEARYQRPGDPDEAVNVDDPRVEGVQAARDVAWVFCLNDGVLRAYKYEDIRASPPPGR